jgi:hypothetical protein
MYGNQLTEEQRQNGLLMALGIGGVAGAAKVADKVADKVASGTKFIPYSKEFAQRSEGSSLRQGNRQGGSTSPD